MDGLVAAARQGLREWFSDLRDDRTLLEEGHFLHALAERCESHRAFAFRNRLTHFATVNLCFP